MTQKLVDGVALDSDAVIWDHDAPGLGLRVQAGKRSWVVRYRVAGVSRQKSLPGNLPLKRARARAAEIRTGAAGGVDVVEAGRATAETARRQAEVAKARSLGAIVELYLADAEKHLRLASLRVARMYLRGQWKALHARPADELTRREVVAVLEPYAGRRTSIQLLRHLSACLSWGMERGLLERHAATGIKPPAQLTSRDRVLTGAELRTISGSCRCRARWFRRCGEAASADRSTPRRSRRHALGRTGPGSRPMVPPCGALQERPAAHSATTKTSSRDHAEALCPRSRSCIRRQGYRCAGLAGLPGQLRQTARPASLDIARLAENKRDRDGRDRHCAAYNRSHRQPPVRSQERRRRRLQPRNLFGREEGRPPALGRPPGPDRCWRRHVERGGAGVRR